MGKQHETIPNEPQETPVQPGRAEVKQPNDPARKSRTRCRKTIRPKYRKHRNRSSNPTIPVLNRIEPKFSGISHAVLFIANSC